MEAHSRAIEILVLDDGTCPYEEWIDGLRDVSFQRAIDARLTRVRNGNFGDHKSVGGGVCELRIPKGPGLRVYYGLEGETLVILLGGGDKSAQQKDIREAQKLWRNRIATR